MRNLRELAQGRAAREWRERHGIATEPAGDETRPPNVILRDRRAGERDSAEGLRRLRDLVGRRLSPEDLAPFRLSQSALARFGRNANHLHEGNQDGIPDRLPISKHSFCRQIRPLGGQLPPGHGLHPVQQNACALV
jgi:hypothetical protein